MLQFCIGFASFAAASPPCASPPSRPNDGLLPSPVHDGPRPGGGGEPGALASRIQIVRESLTWSVGISCGHNRPRGVLGQRRAGPDERARLRTRGEGPPLRELPVARLVGHRARVVEHEAAADGIDVEHLQRWGKEGVSHPPAREAQPQGLPKGQPARAAAQARASVAVLPVWSPGSAPM